MCADKRKRRILNQTIVRQLREAQLRATRHQLRFSQNTPLYTPLFAD